SRMSARQSWIVTTASNPGTRPPTTRVVPSGRRPVIDPLSSPGSLRSRVLWKPGAHRRASRPGLRSNRAPPVRRVSPLPIPSAFMPFLWTGGNGGSSITSGANGSAQGPGIMLTSARNGRGSYDEQSVDTQCPGSDGRVGRRDDRDGYRPDDRRCHTDRKSTRLNSSHVKISYAVFCLKKKKKKKQ